jgi:hypothetical protein
LHRWTALGDWPYYWGTTPMAVTKLSIDQCRLSATLTIIFKYMAGMPSESSAFYEMASGIFLYMAFIEIFAAAVIQAGICDLSMETYFISGKILLALIIPELKTLWIILCPSLTAWFIILDQTARTLFEPISNKIWQ